MVDEVHRVVGCIIINGMVGCDAPAHDFLHEVVFSKRRCNQFVEFVINFVSIRFIKRTFSISSSVMGVKRESWGPICKLMNMMFFLAC